MKRLILILCPLLALSGCQVIADQQATDAHNSLQVIDSAAASLPPSLQVTAIRQNAQAVATSLGQPLNTAPPPATVAPTPAGK